jgi:hypothetical protein
MRAKLDEVVTELRRTEEYAYKTTQRQDLERETRALYQGEAECARHALQLLMRAGLIPEELGHPYYGAWDDPRYAPHAPEAEAKAVTP